jgi:hypothetical protein
MDNNPLFEAYAREKEEENKTSASNIAHAMWLQYDAFVEEGFTPEQALSLISSIMAATLQNTRKSE